MSLNATPSSNRIHIGIFGRRNAGKSSIINAITGQNLAIVSDVKGTTTDPVLKAMELLPLGPVVIIDTPGLDDIGELGELRIQKAYQMLNKTDIAVLVIDSTLGATVEDLNILTRIIDKHIPYIIVWNKCDISKTDVPSSLPDTVSPKQCISVSAKTNTNIHELKELIACLLIVWMLTGLWHGAQWNFMFWGLYYGVILILEKYLWGSKIEKLPAAVQHIYAFVLVLFGWVFFFSPTLGYAGQYLKVMFGIGAKGIFDKQGFFMIFTNWLLIVIAILASAPRGYKLLKKITGCWQSEEVRTIVTCAVYIAMFLLCIAFLVTETYNPFLYFRF